MSQEKYCIHTVHLHMIGIRRLFEHLENTDAILLNPCVGLRLPKLPDRLPRNVLTLSEVKAVLKQPDTQTARGIRDRALLEMFYSTGIRAGEMAALTIHDVDPQNGWCASTKARAAKTASCQWATRPAATPASICSEVRAKWAVENREERALWLASFKPHGPSPNK